MSKERKLIYNGLVTPDNTKICSLHQHDFNCHTDSKTGKQYCVDGGLDYCRYIGDIDECKQIRLFLDDQYNLIREYFEIYYGGRRTIISNISIHTLQSFIDESDANWVYDLCIKELEYRQK